jgi:hypothetical protein
MIVRRWNQGRTRIAKDAQIRTKSDVERLVQSFSELSGGNAQQTSHVHGEMALVGKPGLKGNLADGQAVLAEKDRRPLHAAPDHILMNGHVERLAEKHFAVGNAQTGNPGNIAQGKIVGQVVLNERQHVFQCAAGKTGASEARGMRERTVVVDQSGRKRGGQAFAIEASARIAAFHLFLQGPANVFDLRIADLKAVPESETLRVQARFFGYLAQELRSKA